MDQPGVMEPFVAATSLLSPVPFNIPPLLVLDLPLSADLHFLFFLGSFPPFLLLFDIRTEVLISPPFFTTTVPG